jgi:hypothetical protein
MPNVQSLIQNRESFRIAHVRPSAAEFKRLHFLARLRKRANRIG